MEFERETIRKKRRRKKSPITFILVTITFFSLITCLILLYFNYKQKNEIQEAMAEIVILEESRYTKEQVDEMVSVEKNEILSTMRNMAENGQGILSLLQYFFPDYVICSGNGRYYFFQISDKLAHNNFNLDNFTYPEENENTGEKEGTTTYKIDENTYAKKGIDVSTFQGEIDWKKVKKSGMEYAIIRLGFRGYESGKIVLDSRYEKNIEGSLSAGLDTGVYFFTEALTEEEAIEEADFVIENLEGYKINMPVVIDVEESASPEKTRTKDLTKEQRTKNVIAFCDRIKEAGYDVMIYGNLKSFMLMMDFEQLEEYDKWFAYYRYPFHFPYKIKMWQYTSTENVDGIKTTADVNLMFY